MMADFLNLKFLANCSYHYKMTELLTQPQDWRIQLANTNSTVLSTT